MKSPIRFLPLLLAPLLAGCLYSHELHSMRRALEAEHPDARLDREVVVNLGPLSLRSAGWLAQLAVDDPDAEKYLPYLNDLRRVKVGVYQVEGQLAQSGETPAPVRRLRNEGWQTLVRVREDDEAVSVLYRDHTNCLLCDLYPRSPVRDMYVLTLDDEELVMVRLRGNFERLLRRAFDEHDGRIKLEGLAEAGND